MHCGSPVRQDNAIRSNEKQAGVMNANMCTADNDASNAPAGAVS